MKILFLSKENFWTNEAKKYLYNIFNSTNILFISSNEKYKKFPKKFIEKEGDLLISFLSPWIIPEKLLKNFDLAINFHPGPPEYPGAAGYNFALYENSKEYGVTCHHITKEVDAGTIVKVIRFPINKNETVKSLQDKSMNYLLTLFYEIINMVFEKKELPKSSEQWRGKALTKRDLEKLAKIDTDMDKDEIEKRIRATNYPNRKGAFIDVKGYRFFYDEDQSF